MAASGSDIVPRGSPAAYRGYVGSTTWYYPVGTINRSTLVSLWARTSAGWRVGGHATPDDTFTAAYTGSGSFGSATDVQYTYRVYDNVTLTESAHGPVVTLAGVTPQDKLNAELTFASGFGKQGAETGTHVRFYRTLQGEAAGIFYRIDGTGDGVAIGSMTPGYKFTDTTDNTTAQIQGTVRADGEEGSLLWAEHGGRPPRARGCIVFRDHLVYYGLASRKSDIIYSAQGYPESCPVNFDGDYQYWLRFESSKDDEVLTCWKAGRYLMIGCRNSIHRVAHLPTYVDPGFSRTVQELVTDDHGVCGQFASDSFGVGSDQAQRGVYVSQQHGVMISDGVNTENVVKSEDFRSAVDPAGWAEIEVVNYPKFQEVWIAYRPVGGSSNTEAIIVDYSQFDRIGFRVTGPVDVGLAAAGFAIDNNGEPRLYLADDSSGFVFVQDSGATDAQENTNANGDIDLDWRGARYGLGADRGLVQVHRGFIYGVSGVVRAFTVKHYVLDGDAEFFVQESVNVGPGELSDQFFVEQAATLFREELTYLGPTGSNYIIEPAVDANCAPGIDRIVYEVSGVYPVGVTRQP
jgi:hypothetical protein